MCSTICTFFIITSEYHLPTLYHVEHMIVMVMVMIVVVVVMLMMALVMMARVMMVMVMITGIVMMMMILSPVSILSPPSTTWNTLSTALVGVWSFLRGFSHSLKGKVSIIHDDNLIQNTIISTRIKYLYGGRSWPLSVVAKMTTKLSSGA